MPSAAAFNVARAVIFTSDSYNQASDRAVSDVHFMIPGVPECMTLTDLAEALERGEFVVKHCQGGFYAERVK